MNIFKKIKGAFTAARNYTGSLMRIYKHKQNWRSKNQHNYTAAQCLFPDIVEVGNESYGPLTVKAFGNANEHLTIGNYCCIAENVVFLTGGNHTIKTFSQFPFDAYYKTGRAHQAPCKGPIVVGDDVWIGYGATILSGVTIGQGAIIGAQSIVAKDVPPYAIYVGNKVVKYRYPQNIVDKMVRFDFSKLTPDDVENNSDLLNVDIDESFFDTDFYKKHLKD